MKEAIRTAATNVATFYWRCLRRAFSGKFGIAERWTGGLTVIVLVIAWIASPPAG